MTRIGISRTCCLSAPSGGCSTRQRSTRTAGSDDSGRAALTARLRHGHNIAGPDMDDDGADVLPTYPTQHPRIYIEANKARLHGGARMRTRRQRRASRRRSIAGSTAQRHLRVPDLERRADGRS